MQFRARLILFFMLSGNQLLAQYDKVAALGSDASMTPIGGPASSPPISTEPYDLHDLRPTGELNDRVPGWLQFGLEERFRVEGDSGAGFKPNSSTSYLLNRFRFGVILQSLGWIKVVTQMQDARSFLQSPPLGPPNTVRWDLKLAYIQFGDVERQPVAIAVGRQLIDYNNTILADSQWRNQGRSFDGVVFKVHVDRFRAAVFAASIVNPMAGGITHHQEGNNVYGVYAWITRVLPQSSIEPLVLWRVAPKVAVEDSTAKSGRLDEKAYGFRLRGVNLRNIDYRYEMVIERGSAGANPIRAWATTGATGYTVRSLTWKPRLFAGYDFATGDKNPADGVRGTFDTMYQTAHDRFGITDQFGWQNIRAGRAGGTIIPRRRWSMTAQYVDMWLASATDAAYNSSGGIILRDVTGKSGKHVASELDFYGWYEINRQVHIGAGLGHIFPAEFIDRAGKGASLVYPYFAVEMLDGKRVR